MASNPSPDVTLHPLQGAARPLEDWVTTFHLVTVVLDPYTYESAWLIDTAGRILEEFRGADCRISFLVTADADATRQFLGPWADKVLTFADPDRSFVKAVGLEKLPAIVHIDHLVNLRGSAEGWWPDEWRAVTDALGKVMSWTKPRVPTADDPTPYDGTPALP